MCIDLFSLYDLYVLDHSQICGIEINVRHTYLCTFIRSD